MYGCVINATRHEQYGELTKTNMEQGQNTSKFRYFMETARERLNDRGGIFPQTGSVAQYSTP